MLKLVLHPDERLRKVCRPVTVFDAKLRNTLREMAICMKEWGGIGLAAPQCGLESRMFIADVPGHGSVAFVNPRIKVMGSAISSYEEGCLSLPDQRIRISRPSTVKVKAYSDLGKPFELVCNGLLSTCVQHEYDHLDGVMMFNRMEALHE